MGWTEGQIANESKVRLFHNDGGVWVDITDQSSRNTTLNIVCGVTATLSPFTLFEPGFFQPVDNQPTVNTAKAGSAIPVRFTLGGYNGANIFASASPRVPSGRMRDWRADRCCGRDDHRGRQ